MATILNAPDGALTRTTIESTDGFAVDDGVNDNYITLDELTNAIYYQDSIWRVKTEAELDTAIAANPPVILIAAAIDLTGESAGDWEIPSGSQLTSAGPGYYITTDATHTLTYASGSHGPGLDVRWQVFSSVAGGVVIEDGGAWPIEQFGGVGDDSAGSAAVNNAAFATLVNALENSSYGGIIDFGPGVFHFSDALIVEGQYIGIQGKGIGTSTLTSIYAGEILRFNADGSGSADHNYRGCFVRDLGIEGDGTNTTIGLKMYKCNILGSMVSNVWATKCTDAQFDFEECWQLTLDSLVAGRNSVGEYGIRVTNANNLVMIRPEMMLMSTSATGMKLTGADGVSIISPNFEEVNCGIEITDGYGGVTIQDIYTEDAVGTSPSAIKLGTSAALENVTISGGMLSWGVTAQTGALIDCHNVTNVTVENLNHHATAGTQYFVRTTSDTKQVYFRDSNRTAGGVLAVSDVGDAIVYEKHNSAIYVPATAMSVASGSPVLKTRYTIRTGAYRWLASGSGTAEYYLDLIGGGDPGVPSEPVAVWQNGSVMTAGTVGSLTASQWDWGDNDSLGYNTIYVRLSDDTDPDTKAADYLEAQQNGFSGYKMPDGATSEIAFNVSLPQGWSGNNYQVQVIVYYCSPLDAGNFILSATPIGIASGEDVRSSSIFSTAAAASSGQYTVRKGAYGTCDFTRGDLINVVIRRTGGSGSDNANQSMYVIGAEIRLQNKDFI